MAIGSIPAIMAAEVIKIGRILREPASTAAAIDARRAPALPLGLRLVSLRRWFSAKVISKMPLAMATPIAMMAPMNDSMFNVVRVSHSTRTTPAITAGAVEMVTNAIFHD